MKPKVSIVRCGGYDSGIVDGKVRQAVDLIGGINSFVKPRSKVLVKPNLLMAKGPEFGITTHPDVLRAVIRLLKSINCNIIVGDGPSVWGGYIENVDDVYELTGTARVCKEEDVALVKFEKKRMREKFPLAAILDECDHVVNVPKFKTHEFTLLSAAVKNLFGLVWGTFKTEIHKKYFEKEKFAAILADILQEVKPSLTVVDAVLAMEGDGPGTSGKVRHAGLLLAGADCVAIDSVLALIMGVAPQEVLSTKEAAGRGLGTADIGAISVLGERLQDVSANKFILPSAALTKKVPPWVAFLARKLIRYYPYVVKANCIRCGACVGICPAKVISTKKEGISFDYRGCIACFCCQEVCPASAIKVKKSPLAKIIGL